MNKKKKIISYPDSKHRQIDQQQALIDTLNMVQKAFQTKEVYSFKYMRKIWPKNEQNKIKQAYQAMSTERRLS